MWNLQLLGEELVPGENKNSAVGQPSLFPELPDCFSQSNQPGILQGKVVFQGGNMRLKQTQGFILVLGKHRCGNMGVSTV